MFLGGHISFFAIPVNVSPYAQFLNVKKAYIISVPSSLARWGADGPLASPATAAG